MFAHLMWWCQLIDLLKLETPHFPAEFRNGQLLDGAWFAGVRAK